MHKHLPNVLLALAVILAALQRAGLVQLPPIVPWTLFACIAMSSFWFYSKIGSECHYQEYVYEPLDPYDLTPETRGFFEEQTPGLRRLGFQCLGDTRLQETPHRHDVRMFQSPDGEILGELSSVQGMNGVVAFTSFFEDGVHFETASLESPAKVFPERCDRMQWFYVPGGTAEEIYRRHLEEIENYRAANGCELLAFSPADYQELITYSHRLLWIWRQKRGLTNDEIPEAVIPTPLERFAVS